MIGGKLSSVLGIPFYDSDKVIEEKAGCSIPEIFTRDGEEKFRDSEHRTILELLERGACVIATGGGAVMNSDSLRAMQDKSHLIWIRSDIDTILERTSKSNNRPLLNCENPEEVLEKLLEARSPLYAQAAFVVDNTPRVKIDPVQQILEFLEKQ